MSEFKGVRVLGATGAGHFGQIAAYENANDFLVDGNGHLIVLNGGDRVAAYAPNRWNGVEVVE